MTRTINIKNYLRIGLLGGLFVFIIGYTIFQTKAISKGVDLEISGLKNGETLMHEQVSLSGKALHANHLLVNGREIVIDKENNFLDELVLSPGYNIITVEARDRFDKKTKETFEVFYAEPLGNFVETEIEEQVSYKH